MRQRRNWESNHKIPRNSENDNTIQENSGQLKITKRGKFINFTTYIKNRKNRMTYDVAELIGTKCYTNLQCKE